MLLGMAHARHDDVGCVPWFRRDREGEGRGLATKKKREPVKGHCPSCGPDRMADVEGEHTTSFSDDESGVWGSTAYRILVCRGCHEVYFQTDNVFSEDQDYAWNGKPYIPHKIEHWPVPIKRAEPDWYYELGVFDRDLGNLFLDIYKCLNADLPIPAAIATRTVFDRATELLGIDAGRRFDEKLDDLFDLGKISKDERETLAVLIDAGSAAAHRGWRPELDELETLISIIEAFLHRTFVLGAAAKTLKDSVPSKQRRGKSAGNGS